MADLTVVVAGRPVDSAEFVRQDKVMKCFVQAALLCAFVSGCMSLDAPTQSQASALVASQKERWWSCLGAAYRNARANSVEKNLAAEQAFVTCGTEERAILSYFQSDADFLLTGLSVINQQKAHLKRMMVESGL